MKKLVAKKKTPVKKVRTPKPPPSTMEMLETAIHALVELYAADKTAPGLVISYLTDKNSYYASFARYDGVETLEGFKSRKVIIAAAYGETMDAAIRALIVDWKNGFHAARNLKLMAGSIADFVPDHIDDNW